MLRRLGPAVLLLAVLAPAAYGSATWPVPGLVKADDSITGLQRVGSRIVLTGAFRHIGPYVGGGVALDPRSGARDPAYARFDGQVSDAIPDGKGGLYVAGQFRLGGPVRAVAHVLASGALDSRFDATITGFADALALDGDRLYVGRWFANQGLVALDAATGARITSFKAPTINPVTEVLTANGRVYAGDSRGIFAVDPETGTRDNGFRCQICADRIMSLAAADGRIYWGGQESGLHAIDADTGAEDTAFAPQGNTVKSRDENSGPMVLLVQGDRLIVGGRGMHLGGPSTDLAAVDLTTGAADPAFGKDFHNAVHDLVVSGSSLLVAGAPRSGRPAPVIRIDATTGEYQDALTPKLDGAIDALAMAGSRLFAGGRFGTANAIPTDGVAEVNARTGALVPGFRVASRPGRNYGSTMVVARHRLLFGWTTYTAGVTIARMAGFSARTGVRLRSFRPHPIAFPQAGWVDDARFAATPGRVYIAHPTHYSRDIWAQSGVDVLSTMTGRRIASYDLPYRGYVDAIEPHGDRLFVGGSFLRSWPSGKPRNLATMAVDPLKGTIDDAFDAHTNGPITSITDYRDRLFLDGYFDVAYGRRRGGFVQVYDNTGAINARFSQALGSVSTVSTLVGGYLASGSALAVADPYTGRVQGRIPDITPGFGGSDFVFAPGGAYVTATVDLPYYCCDYQNYAGFVGPLD